MTDSRQGKISRRRFFETTGVAVGGTVTLTVPTVIRAAEKKAPRWGMVMDLRKCIGCRACQVACKQWNRLLATDSEVSREYGYSYDNTLKLDDFHWRHVKFIEQFNAERSEARWLMMSDTCKHCTGVIVIGPV